MLTLERTGAAWAFSIFASAVALVCVKLLFGNPAASFHILIGGDALICARLGGMIAARFGHSSYGSLAALATGLLFALGVPMSLMIFARVASLPADPAQTPFTFAFTFYAISKVVLVFTAPVIIAATAAFNALAWAARKSLD